MRNKVYEFIFTQKMINEINEYFLDSLDYVGSERDHEFEFVNEDGAVLFVTIHAERIDIESGDYDRETNYYGDSKIIDEMHMVEFIVCGPEEDDETALGFENDEVHEKFVYGWCNVHIG